MLKIIDDQEPYEDKSVSKLDPQQFPQELLWFHRQNPHERTDGVLFVPYENDLYLPEGHVSQKHICWYFIMDNSGSMQDTVVGKTFTRWQVAVKLLEKMIQDLQQLHREKDTITVLAFNTQTTLLLENSPPHKVDLSCLKALDPEGPTNISEANTAIYQSMMNNKLLTQKSHVAAEIFFTDGEPTAGVIDASLLRSQKQSLYVNIKQAMNGFYPFLWCGGISDDANLQVIKGLSSASPYSLWAFISDDKTEEFAAELGGLVGLITHMKLMNIPVHNYSFANGVFETESKSVMLIADTPNLFYFKHRPLLACQHQTTNVSADHWVSLFKITEMLQLAANDQLVLEKEDLQDLEKRAQQRNLDAVLQTSPLWSRVFQNTQENIAKNIDLLQTEQQKIQISSYRTQANLSQEVQIHSQEYVNIYTQFDNRIDTSLDQSEIKEF